MNAAQKYSLNCWPTFDIINDKSILNRMTFDKGEADIYVIKRISSSEFRIHIPTYTCQFFVSFCEDRIALVSY